jgi:tripartite ATP-independent transporter DctP family solute receptor
MTITRRSLILGASVAAMSAPFSRAFGQKAEFTYKFAHNLPITHPLHLRAQELVAAVLTQTNGRVEIQVFPNSQLGNDTDVLSQVRNGGVEFFSLSGLILQTLVPASGISGIGFAFPDYPSVWKAMDGDLGAYIRDEISKKGLIAMDKIWDNGFRQITTSTRPINTADDLKGMKLRVPPSPLWTSMFKALDAAPASINFAEVYSALQTKVVEGQENPLAIINTAKLYEVQKYLSISNHMWDGFWMLANKKAWERLPADLRTIVAKNFNEAGLKQRTDVEALNATLQKELAAAGMTINDTNKASLRDKLLKAGFYAEWKAKFGEAGWSVLERYTGKL